MEGTQLDKEKEMRFGHLKAKYNFSLNPYPELRFSKCPVCQGKTGQRKLPLLIHIDPKNLITLNYTNRYCPRCDRLIGHKHEIEHLLTDIFSQHNPSIIGNNYLLIGTLEKKAWQEGLKQPQLVQDMLPYVHDFKDYGELRMTMAGWFPKDQEPPVMPPSPSTEWIKKI